MSLKPCLSTLSRVHPSALSSERVGPASRTLVHRAEHVQQGFRILAFRLLKHGNEAAIDVNIVSTMMIAYFVPRFSVAIELLGFKKSTPAQSIPHPYLLTRGWGQNASELSLDEDRVIWQLPRIFRVLLCRVVVAKEFFWNSQWRRICAVSIIDTPNMD